MSSTGRFDVAVPAPVRAFLLCLVLGLGGWFSGAAASMLFAGQLYALGYSIQTLDEIALSIAFNVVGLGGLALSYLVLRRQGFDRAFVVDFLRIRKPSAADFAIVVAGLVGAFLLVMVYNVTIEFVDPFGTGSEGTTHSGIEETREYPILFLLAIPLAIVLTGPGEELLFRGVIQSRLRENFSTVAAIVLAGFVFAVVHLPVYAGGDGGQVLVSLGTVTVLGLYFGVLYEATGNLVVPALIHGCYNAIVYLMNYFTYA